MLLDIGFLDDTTRPTVPRLENLTRAQQAAGEHLKEIHDLLRANVASIETLIRRAAEGLASRDDIAAETDGMALVANFRRFGNLCGQYCQFVHGHHALEDQYVFPQLAAVSDGYRRVTERLVAEHHVVHELLERQIATLNALAAAPTPENFAAAREVFEALKEVLLSHLGYEEDQIGDALGFYGVM